MLLIGLIGLGYAATSWFGAHLTLPEQVFGYGPEIILCTGIFLLVFFFLNESPKRQLFK